MLELFILAVGNDYESLQYVGNFRDCDTSEQYYNEHCADTNKVGICLLESYSILPVKHVPIYSADISKTNRCGYLGEPSIFIKEEYKWELD
tara:strand:+ start:276 stop:548 length:273 start_codon:yes stop_codon:yes gene_type:complete